MRAYIRADDDHMPITRLVCMENTQNNCGGVCAPTRYTHTHARTHASILRRWLGFALGSRKHGDGWLERMALDRQADQR